MSIPIIVKREGDDDSTRVYLTVEGDISRFVVKAVKEEAEANPDSILLGGIGGHRDFSHVGLQGTEWYRLTRESEATVVLSRKKQ